MSVLLNDREESICESTLNKPPLVIILGPTAVGKTDLSLRLAKHLNGEIVSGDSRLIYRGMDIGTAKPPPEELASVPHHLIDVTDLGHPWSLAVFQSAVNKAITDITQRGRLPIMVGGTGQYIRAISEGWEIPAVKPNPELRLKIEAWAEEIGVEQLYIRLETLDPLAAEKIDPRNLRRIVRVLEVIFTTGHPFSEQKQRRPPQYRILKIGLYRSREELYQRIDARLDAMIEAGFVEEVKKLLDQGYAPDLPGFSGIGYPEMIAYIQGDIDLEGALTVIKRKTRVFVRHQANWFKMDDPTIHWFQVDGDMDEAVEETITNWLHGDRG